MASPAEPSILGWLGDPSEVRGVRSLVGGADWQFFSYAWLADLVARIAAGIVDCGVRRDDVVWIVQKPGPYFIGTLYAAMRIGAIPAPLAPPGALQNPDRYREHIGAVMRSEMPALLVVDPEYVEYFREVIPGRTVVGSESCLREDGITEAPAVGRYAVLQYTSGSSGTVRGVRLSFDALTANVNAIREWLEWTSEDGVGSWLPVYHDMGLIACVISPATSQSDLWLMSPAQFVRDPLAYLRCFGESGARLSAMPNFGLDIITSRVRPESLDGMDFSAWRALVVGAEPLKPQSLSAFDALLGPHGLPATALCPAYGLAEATLAVTGVRLRERWSTSQRSAVQLAIGQSVDACFGEEVAQIVDCGRPLRDVSVRIVDEEGHDLGDGRFGEIVVTGASCANRCDGRDDGLRARTVDGLSTGDGAYLDDGRLYVVGRFGDSMKIRGRIVFCEDLESELAAAGCAGRGFAITTGWHENQPTVFVVAEADRRVDPGRIEASLRGRAEGARILVRIVPKGMIPRTSSGKVKRRALWARCTAEEAVPLDMGVRPAAAIRQRTDGRGGR